MEDDLTLKQSIGYFLTQVPEPVRDFVLNELSGATEQLMQRYDLHVDQGGVLQSQLLLMLLGQTKPADFMTALQNAGIPASSIQSLMKDVNEEIFKKLRAREQASEPIPVQMPRSEPIQPRSLPEMPVYQSAPATFTPAPAISTPTPVAPTPTEPVNSVRTMQGDMDRFKSGGFQSTPAPTSPWEQPVPAPASPQPVVPTPVPEPQTPIVKDYSVDPYREPIQ